MNDNLNFGSDASIDNFTTRTICYWFENDLAANTSYHAVGKGRFAAAWAIGNDGGGGGQDKITFGHDWGGTNATWRTTTGTNVGQGRRHIAVTYDNSLTTNDPVMYLDGASEPVTETVTPTGGATADAANNLQMGENTNNALDFNGRMGWFVYHNGILDAAAINRAKWWGRPHGGMTVYHPLVTTKLANEGSATATATASGTTVASFTQCPPVVRPGSAMLGLGIGW